jgi:hypothetical protein
MLDGIRKALRTVPVVLAIAANPAKTESVPPKEIYRVCATSGERFSEIVRVKTPDGGSDTYAFDLYLLQKLNRPDVPVGFMTKPAQWSYSIKKLGYSRFEIQGIDYNKNLRFELELADSCEFPIS